jgi:hypothetical protein
MRAVFRLAVYVGKPVIHCCWHWRRDVASNDHACRSVRNVIVFASRRPLCAARFLRLRCVRLGKHNSVELVRSPGVIPVFAGRGVFRRRVAHEIPVLARHDPATLDAQEFFFPLSGRQVDVELVVEPLDGDKAH